MRYRVNSTVPVENLIPQLPPDFLRGKTILSLDHFVTDYLLPRANDFGIRELINGGHDFYNYTKYRSRADVIFGIPDYYAFEQFTNWCDNSGAVWFALIKAMGLWHSRVYEKMATLQWRWFNIGNAPNWLDENNRKCCVDVRWYSNLPYTGNERGIELHTMQENLLYNPSLLTALNRYGWTSYPTYDDVDVLWVPRTDSIPSDYDGAMAVPISVFDNFSPKQFECLPKITARRNRGERYIPFRAKLGGKASSQKVLVAHI